MNTFKFCLKLAAMFILFVEHNDALTLFVTLRLSTQLKTTLPVFYEEHRPCLVRVRDIEPAAIGKLKELTGGVSVHLSNRELENSFVLDGDVLDFEEDSPATLLPSLFRRFDNLEAIVKSLQESDKEQVKTIKVQAHTIKIYGDQLKYLFSERCIELIRYAVQDIVKIKS